SCRADDRTGRPRRSAPPVALEPGCGPRDDAGSARGSGGRPGGTSRAARGLWIVGPAHALLAVAGGRLAGGGFAPVGTPAGRLAASAVPAARRPARPSRVVAAPW